MQLYSHTDMLVELPPKWIDALKIGELEDARFTVYDDV
jgi:hypothetical protein